MERPYFIADKHLNYLKEMAESGLFTWEEIRPKFIETFPGLSTFKINRTLIYSKTIINLLNQKP